MRQSARMIKAAEFRRMALALRDVVEGSHMGHPDFRAGGTKIFATLNADQTRGMVSLAPDQQKEFMREHPAMFTPASGAWGVQGATMVELSHADSEVVGEAMTYAWQRAMARLQAQRPKSTRKAKLPRKPGRQRRN